MDRCAVRSLPSIRGRSQQKWAACQKHASTVLKSAIHSVLRGRMTNAAFAGDYPWPRPTHIGGPTVTWNTGATRPMAGSGNQTILGAASSSTMAAGNGTASAGFGCRVTNGLRRGSADGRPTVIAAGRRCRPRRFQSWCWPLVQRPPGRRCRFRFRRRTVPLQLHQGNYAWFRRCSQFLALRGGLNAPIRRLWTRMIGDSRRVEYLRKETC